MVLQQCVVATMRQSAFPDPSSLLVDRLLLVAMETVEVADEDLLSQQQDLNKNLRFSDG